MYTYICVYNLYIHVYIYMYTHNIHIYIYLSIYACRYVCIYIYMYMCTLDIYIHLFMCMYIDINVTSYMVLLIRLMMFSVVYIYVHCNYVRMAQDGVSKRGGMSDGEYSRGMRQRGC